MGQVKLLALSSEVGAGSVRNLTEDALQIDQRLSSNVNDIIVAVPPNPLPSTMSTRLETMPGKSVARSIMC